MPAHKHCKLFLPTVKLAIIGRPATVQHRTAWQGLLDWFEVDLGFTKLLFVQIDLCVLFSTPPSSSPLVLFRNTFTLLVPTSIE